VALLGGRTLMHAPGPVAWSGEPPTRPYPFEGPPRFEFSATAREVRSAQREVRARAERAGDRPLAVLGWRSVRLERAQREALFPSSEGWLVHALGVRSDSAGELSVDLATNRSPQRPFFEASCRLSGRELLLAFAIRIP
jgi:hypothetical protein